MIIQELRLKNIRSYGTGHNGNGITIKLHPGVNRISGKNGHGKSTIIEAIGYALFEVKPQCIENFDLNTYFVRTGCSSAEIDITFSYNQETYRIERGLGSSNKRRAKAVLVSNNSICAENEREVSAFLCRLLGFVDSNHLSEAFTKLIGIKQGHLTRPFDSKPSHAKDFFEPLLEVEIFRRCYDQIKPAIDKIDAQINKYNYLLAIEEERIRERQDSPKSIEIKRETLIRLEQQVQTATESLISLGNEKEKLETTPKIIADATHRRNEAKLVYNIQKQNRIHAQTQMAVSQKAADKIRHIAPSYNLFVEAELKIKKLREQQDQQRKLVDQKNSLAHHRLELNSSLQATKDHVNLLATQIEAKNIELTQIKEEHLVAIQQLEQSDKDFQNITVTIQQTEEDISLIRAFVTSQPKKVAHQQQLLTQIVKLSKECITFDYIQLSDTHNIISQSDKQLQESISKLAVLQERHRNSKLQKRSINSGLCPFSQKRCYFHADINMGADLDRLSTQIDKYYTLIRSKSKIVDALKKKRDELIHNATTINNQRNHIEKLVIELKKSVETTMSDDVFKHVANLSNYISTIPNFPGCPIISHKDHNSLYQAAADFQCLTQNWWETTEPLAIQMLNKAKEELSDIVRKHYHVNRQNDLLLRLADEIKLLEKTKHTEYNKLQVLENQYIEANKTMAACTAQLAEFDHLNDELIGQINILDTNRANYLEYLGIQSIAEQTTYREIELQSCLAMEKATAYELTSLDSALEVIQAGFDEQTLYTTTARHLEKSNEVAVCATNYNYAKEHLRLEELRYREWEQACAAKNQILQSIERLVATKNLGDLARNVLKQVAPVVAQYLCNAIATRAQKIFNLINEEPIELLWYANRYSLRIMPGERRFAMLSGGEQNKLALAMVLAMIEEFSDLKFCIFDEPTYGIDTNSRGKLANAILAAQDAAKMEQLIIVSHDEIFESQIEHCVLLQKTSTYGTEVKYSD